MSPLRVLPRPVWVVVALAAANAVVWSLLTPPFRGPDESAHVAYVGHVADRGVPPGGVGAVDRAQPELGPDYDLVFRYLPFNVEGPPTWSATQERELRRRLRDAPHTAGAAVNQAV